MGYRWYGQGITTRVKKEFASTRLTKAAIFVKNEIKRRVSRAGTVGQGANKKIIHSLPGEYPRRQTGFFRMNINHLVDRAKLKAYVGTPAVVFYARFLEFGTRKMAARPWLYRTVLALRRQVINILKRGHP